MVLNTSNASRPKLKKEKKYYRRIRIWERCNLAWAYLVDSICFVTIHNAYLESLRELDDWTFFNVDDVLDRQRYLDTVSVIVRSKYYLLQCLHPFFGTCMTIRFQIICPLMSNDREARHIFALFLVLIERCRDAIS